jgi:hypothetical protein
MPSAPLRKKICEKIFATRRAIGVAQFAFLWKIIRICDGGARPFRGIGHWSGREMLTVSAVENHGVSHTPLAAFRGCMPGLASNRFSDHQTISPHRREPSTDQNRVLDAKNSNSIPHKRLAQKSRGVLFRTAAQCPSLGAQRQIRQHLRAARPMCNAFERLCTLPSFGHVANLPLYRRSRGQVPMRGGRKRAAVNEMRLPEHLATGPFGVGQMVPTRTRGSHPDRG